MTQTAAVHGLGGIGKSVLAREFGWRHQGDYAGVWWLDAGSTSLTWDRADITFDTTRVTVDATHIDSVEQGLVELGATFIRGLNEVDDRAAAARQTLDLLAHGGFDKPWLLILDNVDDPALLRRLAPLGNCHVRLTTRLSSWSGTVATIPLGVWPLDQAVEYLVNESGRADLAGESAEEIAEAVDCLPLALSHAAALLRARPNITASSYLETLTRRMREAPADATYRQAVFATFEAALEEADRQAEGARAIMALIALLAPGEVPEELLRQDAACCPLSFQAVLSKEGGLDDALGALAHLSLIDFKAATRTFSAHRMVLAAAADGLGEDRSGWIASAFRAVYTAFPEPSHDSWRASERLIAHVSAVLTHGPNETREAAWLLSAAGSYLQERVALKDALQSFKASLAIAERLAAADPDNAGWQRGLSVSHNKIGDVQSAQGNLKDALESFKASLAIRERLAAADPGNAGWQRDLAVSHGRVALVQSQIGDTGEALEGLRQGRAIVANLRDRAPELAVLSSDLAWFDSRIAELGIEG